MKASVRLLVTSALALAVASGVGFAEAASPAKASVSFSRGAWDRGKWSVLKSPRWNYLHGFEQLDDCIANETPGTKTIDWYSSMAYNGKFGVGDTVTVRMGFDDKFAPGVVIASELPEGKDGVKELRDHFEIILFEGGLNVWQYKYVDGRFVITKPAYLVAPFPNKTPLDVTVAVTEKSVIGGGKTRQMTVTCGERVFGFRSDDIPATFYAGINANEGRCRFHAFEVK